VRVLRRSLGAKLLVAQLLVVVAGAATLLLVATTLGPWLFDRHLRDAPVPVPDALMSHIHMAFDDALGSSLGLAVAAATLTAVLASVVLARRIVAPVTRLSECAQAVAAGRYDTRADDAGEDELARLADAFNRMAGSLEDTERVRTRMVADVAHELRTPLATLDGYLEGIADGVIAPDAATIDTMRAQTRRMSRLAEDLALVSRAEERRLPLKIRTVDPAALLHTAARAARPAAEAAGVGLHVSSELGLTAVRLDPERMGQVLGNLLENALRHTPRGGAISLAARPVGGSVEIVVADTGEGIPAEELERVFTRFHRVDAARTHDRGGSGIGLTVARAIVETHAGTITAESDGSGHGSRFRLLLPIGGPPEST
jgi:signal transduction histidine kinase